jgi:type I restriction enzyme S subunit
MIANLKPYPAMKDSRVEWLREVPENWEVKKLKHVVSFCGGGTPSKAIESFWNGHIPWVSPKDMRSARITDAEDHITEESVLESATSIVAPGAVVVVVRSGILRRKIPVAINDVDVALNQDMKALRPISSLASEYLLALIQGNHAALRAEWTKQGATVESIEHEFMANSHIPLPPLPEQTAIVRFLDYVNQRIRRYIRAKQKLIGLLEEQKQAIIHRAVTRGLDPDVPLKPSGVEWLGDVPEHWGVKKLRVNFRYAKGSRAAELTNEYIGRNAGPYPVYSGQTENRGLMGTISWHEFDFASAVILVTTVGARAMSTRVLSGKFSLSQNCALIIARDDSLNVPFYEMVLQRLFSYERATISLILQPSLRFMDLNRFYVPHPPPEEQRRIAESVGSQLDEIQALSERTSKQAAAIREYRTRLIADVVTGKLDVREAAAKLPEDPAEPEAVGAAVGRADIPEEAEP